MICDLLRTLDKEGNKKTLNILNRHRFVKHF